MRIVFTPRARRRALTVAKWWRENRPDAPDLFEQELEWARRRMVSQPQFGQAYERIRNRTILRVLLPKTEQHVYYSVEEETETVTVHSIWGARRGRAPKL